MRVDCGVMYCAGPKPTEFEYIYRSGVELYGVLATLLNMVGPSEKPQPGPEVKKCSSKGDASSLRQPFPIALESFSNGPKSAWSGLKGSYDRKLCSSALMPSPGSCEVRYGWPLVDV